MKVTVKGDLHYPCTPKDLTLAIHPGAGRQRRPGQGDRVLRPAVEALDLPGRITLSSMVTEMAASSGLIPPSKAC